MQSRLLLKHIGLKPEENDFKDIELVHEGKQDAYYQCDQQVITKTSLKPHKELVHEGVKYLGDQCDYQS